MKPVKQSKTMDIQAINDLAKRHFDNKDFQAALDVLSSVELPVGLIPNLAKCYYYTKRAHKALELVKPLQKTHELWIDTALYHNAIGEHRRSLEIYESLDQSDPKVQFNKGWHLLREGKFQEGFQSIQHGDKCRAWGHEYLYIENGTLNKRDRWAGEFTDHLLLILEGGLGDQIIFVRWAEYLKSRCNRLTILCDKSLLRLLTNSGYDCAPLDAIRSVSYTKYCPAMSLPAIASMEHPKQGVHFPYIKSFVEPYVTKQMNSLAGSRKKIGVRFYGNKEFEHDQFRSPPREDMESLAEFGQLFSLQLEEDGGIPNCKHLIRDWQDTYSVFANLDLLVTSCTSTAHLAGAMGIQAIVLVPFVPYLVWASDSLPWYGGNVTIVRQAKYNDWSSAMLQMKQLVAEALRP